MAAEALSHWDAAAPNWDEMVGDTGNDYWTLLQAPALQRMLNVKPGESALDLATGNGIVARWLRDRGATVVATDGSLQMLEVASARTMSTLPRRDQVSPAVSFEQLDLVDEDAVKRFIDAQNDNFDIITMNMAMMDIHDLKPMAFLISALLKPGAGRFVATLLHPVFFTSGAVRCVEVDEDAQGRRRTVRYIKLHDYLDVAPRKAGTYLPSPGAEYVQVMFHRPLHELLAPFFAHGLSVDALEEPNFDGSVSDESRPYSSKSYTQFPKLLAFRLRKLERD